MDCDYKDKIVPYIENELNDLDVQYLTCKDMPPMKASSNGIAIGQLAMKQQSP